MGFIVNIVALLGLIAFFVVKIFVYLISGNVNLTSTFAISGFVSLILFITNKIGGIDTFIFVFFVLSIFFLGGLLNETYRKRKRYKDMKWEMDISGIIPWNVFFFPWHAN